MKLQCYWWQPFDVLRSSRCQSSGFFDTRFLRRETCPPPHKDKSHIHPYLPKQLRTLRPTSSRNRRGKNTHKSLLRFLLPESVAGEQVCSTRLFLAHSFNCPVAIQEREQVNPIPKLFMFRNQHLNLNTPSHTKMKKFSLTFTQ